jgi:hypothetical protein
MKTRRSTAREVVLTSAFAYSVIAVVVGLNLLRPGDSTTAETIATYLWLSVGVLWIGYGIWRFDSHRRAQITTAHFPVPPLDLIALAIKDGYGHEPTREEVLTIHNLLVSRQQTVEAKAWAAIISAVRIVHEAKHDD